MIVWVVSDAESHLFSIWTTEDAANAEVARLNDHDDYPHTEFFSAAVRTDTQYLYRCINEEFQVFGRVPDEEPS